MTIFSQHKIVNQMKGNAFLIVLFAVIFLAAGCRKKEIGSNTFYVDSNLGSDVNDGLSPKTAWKTLRKASEQKYQSGDKLLLSEGAVFTGKLILQANGSPDNPVLVSCYPGDDNLGVKPVINASGYLAGIEVRNGDNVEINNIEITADAGEVHEEGARDKRYGIYIETDTPGNYSNITLKALYIHDIFASENVENDGQNPTSNLGYGIFITMKNLEAPIGNVKIEDCKIEMTGHTGIRAFGYAKDGERTYIDSLTIVNNILENIGGPGMVPGLCKNVLVRGNVTNHTGSTADPRMHNRGSGIWPWTSEDVLIEKNKFMNAWGKMDSYGCHIDYNCKNVVVQYNLSINNSGGFVEILGNDYNCSYRYNVSINDGYRQKGVNGVVHEGKILWTSGYVGKNPRTGPINSYIYNNTIFVKEEYATRFSFARTTDGILIANNIFYIMGESVDVEDNGKTGTGTIQNVVFENNLYQRTGIVPESVIIEDSAPLFGDPQFKNPGGLHAEDYIPGNVELIKNKGIEISKLPNDSIGLVIGLKPEFDILGNKIEGLPDLGAVEIK